MSATGYGSICLLSLASCFAGCQPSPPPVSEYLGFANPQPVAITGYSGDAMEPFISPDGQYLFFNNSNSAAVDTNLFYATRVDDLTFQYRGEIGGANSTALDAVASMDRNGAFYFVSTRSYDQTLTTLYSGQFAGGALTGVAVIPGISRQQAGIVYFDAGISADGSTLYFVDAQFNGGAMPQGADLVIATRSATGFQRLPDSADLLKNVNSDSLEYAPCIAQSGLELFFTRFSNNATAVYRATRSSLTQPFELPEHVSAVVGNVVEAPTLSPDEKGLYYHQQVGGVFAIYRVTR